MQNDGNTSEKEITVEKPVTSNVGGGMTLEDDVESILSEQFNVSNESMFRVRGEIKVNANTANAPSAVSASGFGGFGGGAGDSTYRACDDSVYGYDEDRGLISESDNGDWYTNTGEKDNALA